MNELEWQGNSKAMVQGILNATPSFFRGTVKNRIQKWVSKNNIKVVTEDIVFKAVDEIAPYDLANSKIKPELMKMRTK
jgi:hypothetical protein